MCTHSAESVEWHNDDLISWYNIHFVTDVPSPIDFDLDKSIIAQDPTIDLLKEVI